MLDSEDQDIRAKFANGVATASLDPRWALIREIRQLEALGIIGREECPRETHWHWPILKMELLPAWVTQEERDMGEIRWYGESSR